MRKILFAMLGLVAIGLWALPAAAVPTSGGVEVDGPAKVRPGPVPLENRAGNIGAMARGERFQGALMSGTLIRQSAVTTSWFMYPGVCVQRSLGTWSPKSSPVADSLQPTPGFPDSNFPNPFASGTVAPAGLNNDLVFTSQAPGAGANNTNVRYVNPGTPNAALLATVDGCPLACTQNIKVSLATDGTGAVTTIAAADPLVNANSVKNAIETSADASHLVRVANAGGNDGSGVVTAMAATFLSGGVNPVRGNYLDNQPDITNLNNQIAYTRVDQSLSEILWHVVDVSDPVGQRPTILDGSRNLWCGKFDANWKNTVGYPNLTFQILYIDTGVHTGGNYSFSFLGNLSSELNYDYNTLIGGGTAGGVGIDPLANRRDLFAPIMPQFGVSVGGPDNNSRNLVAWTGSILAPQTNPASTNTTTPLNIIVGDAGAQPNTVSYTVTGINPVHRALYFVFTADCLFSSEDGLWPLGHGSQIDDVATSDNGPLYTDEVATGGFDAHEGNVVKGSYGTGGFIACRVPAGVGELWQLTTGVENFTADICSPQKAFLTDLFFEGGDPTSNNSIDKQFNSVLACTFPVPVGTASIFATWTEYLDLPRFAGLVQYAEYRFFKGGSWSNWDNTSAGGGVTTGANQAWLSDGDELAQAVQADSFQVRYNIQCIPPFAADRKTCANNQQNALLYDDFGIRIVSGIPAPLFGIFPGSVAQSMFVDGTIHGTLCTTSPCWPGIRGSELPSTPDFPFTAVKDNWNAATGDSITLAIVTGLRKNGMGVNWRHGIDKTILNGENYQARTNQAWNPALDFPRMIYRLWDPLTKAWSAFDSCEIYANVSISGADTSIIDSEYAINWPPDDKLRAGASLPGGFTLNGVGAYAGLRFLPRGTRMQYYFKGVDIDPTHQPAYTFSSDNLAREVEDLPTLPGSSLKAPDIIEFDVLPTAYPAGPGGSLLAGHTDTPVLNLDGVYTTWAFGYDPMVQALRGLGVRADRFRFLASGTTANHFGGHELPGKRPDRLSNFFPNYLEYPIADSLAKWYRIIIESSHTRTATVFNEQDAKLAEDWWRRDTGSNQGDRCIFASGDNMFNTLLKGAVGIEAQFQTSLANNVFGVSDVLDAWSGTLGTPYPTIDDRFAAASAGPALAPANTYTYPVDGGCPGPNRFDKLVPVVAADNASSAFYPNLEVAGVARSREMDNVGDKDRNKALSYGFSIQFIRDPAYGVANANYTRAGVENRMRVLYKFLTSCRGLRTGAAADTGKCWPCPSPGTTLALMQADWNGQAVGFQTGTWGPLYPIQAGALATAVDVGEPDGAPRINKINGNFPNPFNPQTAIRFASAQAGKAEVRIFSVGGRLVRTLRANVVQGANEVRWNGKRDDGSPVASGVYFYKILFPNGQSFRAPNSLVLVK